MEELIKIVTEKAGIKPEQAKTAVSTVVDFLKAKLPGIGDTIAGVLGGAGGGGGVADALGGLKGKLGL